MSDGSLLEPVSLTVESRAHGWRLDHYLARVFANYSRGVFQRAIQQQRVLVNGLPVKPSRRLRVNDRITVELPEQADESLIPEEIPLEALYEDESLVVINKPADMVTHPGKANYRGTLAGALQFHFDQLSDAAGLLRPGIVHRLDRDTSGVIVVAKNNQIHHRLSGQFERREVTKEYFAIVRGEVAADAGVIETHLKMHPKVREKMIVCTVDAPNARHAVTEYRVAERFHGFTAVSLFPKTGRTHQLRVHMRHVGHPIVADRLYAGHAQLLLGEVAREATNVDADATLMVRQALHARRLTIRHPLTDGIQVFEAPLPDDIVRTLDALRRYRKQNS